MPILFGMKNDVLLQHRVALEGVRSGFEDVNLTCRQPVEEPLAESLEVWPVEITPRRDRDHFASGQQKARCNGQATGVNVRLALNDVAHRLTMGRILPQLEVRRIQKCQVKPSPRTIV